ncbi:hypothetical protein [Chondrinema litorale]|uniref:hypothetical protein n=1 Tax=Chondrinema litorale TaxID=2994555 RepID=UPI002542F214|nr:hypothetical protein [Chondrinema litorale]UZR93026.1 hypothetical protein OQ292_14285 [Chondrinema litorale]
MTSCKDSANIDSGVFATDEIPQELPIPFKPELVPDNYLIHRGVFSNDLEEYYFTISDSAFANFSIKVNKRLMVDGLSQKMLFSIANTATMG